MPHFTIHDSYNSQKPIWAFSHGIRHPNSITIDRKFISADKNGSKAVPAGMFGAHIKTITGELVERLLPRGKVSTPVTLTTNRFKVGYPYVFVAGDELTIHEAFAQFTITGTGQGGLRVNGRSVTFTPTGVGTPQEAALAFSEYFNSSPYLSRIFRFLAEGNILYVIVKDGYTPYQITPSGAFGTIPATTVPNPTPIGKVLFVDGEKEEIVLDANAAVAVPVGFNVGVPVERVYGLLESSFDVTNARDSVSLGLGTEGSVYQGSLPYWDESILEDLPNLQVQYRF
jgi:hypothetical protein